MSLKIRSVFSMAMVLGLVSLSLPAMALNSLISSLPSIDEDHVERLEKVGVVETRTLYIRTFRSAARVTALASRTGIDSEQMAQYVAMADLCRIVRITPKRAYLLVMAGIHSSAQLAEANRDDLFKSLKEHNEEHNLTRYLPDAEEVGLWIEAAAKLGPRDWEEKKILDQ